ncbi:ATP-binding cassette domain-containing protein [Maridesulfovibrio ferrireducens]|uniref:ATP-binding cassette domain-containing protein n=1 Tax=Maridesulfovibrio ferrireducens TaxID=246191 RepID=UPI001A1CD275|nr:ATP-binding cassette domain-containing protein [Maridesulfovibrio ferrireducens]MBI9110133.1 ATP-binding cassette domain-containing protein [Maridesulfovibrio ferrireducens]
MTSSNDQNSSSEQTQNEDCTTVNSGSVGVATSKEATDGSLVSTKIENDSDSAEADEDIGIFDNEDDEIEELGTTIASCLKKVADKFGIVATEQSLQMGNTSSLNEYLRLQAENMGLDTTFTPLPPKLTKEDIPAIVQYPDGSFAVIEKKIGKQLSIWSGKNETIRNNKEDLCHFNDWTCSFDIIFETDRVSFLSLSWFIGQVVKMWPLYSQVILATVLIHCFTLVIPLLMGIFYDRILPNLAENSLRVLITGAIFVLFFDYILKNIRTSLVEKAALRVEREAEPYLLAQILDTIHAKLPSSSGHLTHSVQEFSRIKSLFTTQLVVGSIDFFFLFFFLFVIYLNSGMLFIVPALISFLVLLVSIVYGFFIDNNVSAQSKLQSRKSSFLNEVFQGIESIKTTNAARLFISRWTTEVEKSGEMSSKYRIAQARCSMTTGFLGQLNSAGLLIVAFFLISEGSMTSGALLATMVLSGRCIAASASMSNLITSYLFARRSYKDLKELLSLEKETTEVKQYKVQQVHGAISFDGVSFRYFPESPFVLENVSFKTKAGEKIGIIGPMGSGKTTLLKLIAGLATPTEGVILLDDHNMAYLNIEKVREHMGVVPQSPVLFYGTLEFNLLMGARTVTQETLQNALAISGIEKFVSKHPLGLKMQILEGGKNLSRGQRQAVAIARALIDNPPLMLLDEPTSSMDSTQEKIFIQRMKNTMAKKTLFIVTHRPHILQIVDRILVIDQGKIVADDTRDRIISKLSNQ